MCSQRVVEKESDMEMTRVGTSTSVAAVALANKMVRVAWAMLRDGGDFEPARAAA